MLAWLSENWLNAVLIAVLLLIVGLIVFGMIRNKKAGKRPCGCDCAACGACKKCCAVNPARNGKSNEK